MKKPQWITIVIGIILVTVIYTFGRIVPIKKNISTAENHEHSPDDGHDHSQETAAFTTDSILNLAKKQLNSEQITRLNFLENSISRGDVKAQQLKVYRQLSRFWGDSLRIFEPYAWYEAEAARLENSEKTLTFAAHLFLENLQQNHDPQMIKWKALQAKDLFERSLKINPDNDSSKVGLGSCYLFGSISAAPMEGISKIREVLDKDSTHAFALITLAKAAIISGQYDKAIERLQTANRQHQGNLEAILMLADVYERIGEKKNAAGWYEKSLEYIDRPAVEAEIKKRIGELRK